MKKLRGIHEKLAGSGVWWIQYFDVDGERRREKVGSRSSAIHLYRKRKTEALEGKKLPEKLRSKAISFSQLATEALEYSKANKVSWQDDVCRMGFLEKAFGNRPAESIKPQDIDRWLNGLENRKPATLNRYRALLSLVYRLGIANGKIAINPARLVRQRKENNARIRFLGTEEETKLRVEVEKKFPHHLPELDLALHTGLRKSEQYNLTWDNVDFERRFLTVPRSKNGETRRVTLNDTAIAALRTAQRYSLGQQHVFLNRYGQQLMNPREWFEASISDAGIRNFTWHCLRHTFASRLVMAGVDIRTVQELLGHKTIQMTVRYAHLAPEHQLAAVQALCDNKSGATQKEASATTSATSDVSTTGTAIITIN